MKKIIRRIIAIFMILLGVIPFLVVYDPLSRVIPKLPIFDAPSWFVPVGFINIACIIILAFILAFTLKD